MPTSQLPRIEVGHGRSGADDARSAGAAAARQALGDGFGHELSAVFVFASARYDQEELLAGVRDVVGAAHMVGGTTSGEICDGLHHGSVVVVALASPFLAMNSALGHNVSHDWQAAVDQALSQPSMTRYFGEEADAYRDSLKRQGKSLFALVLTPGETLQTECRGHEIFGELRARSGGRIPMFGGGVSDGGIGKTSFVFTGGQPHEDSLLVAVFETQITFGMGVCHSYAPLRPRRAATRTRGHEILEIEGQPADIVFAEMLGTDVDDLRGKDISSATGTAVDIVTPRGDYTITLARCLTEQHGVRLAQSIEEGASISINRVLEESVAETGSQAVLRAIADGGITGPAVVLAFASARREQILGERMGKDIAGLTQWIPGVHAVGFLSSGEEGVHVDGVGRFGHGLVSTLVIGGELTPAAEVWQEQQRREAMVSDLHAVLNAFDALSTCPDVDSVCRAAVTIARDKLGIERCAIFLLDGEDGTRIRGTYGTDMAGQTTDEHAHHPLAGEFEWGKRVTQLRERGLRWELEEGTHWEWDGSESQPVGEGWIGVTSIQCESSGNPLGVMFNDCAISGGPVDRTKQEMLAVFCATLGGVLERKRSEERQQTMVEDLHRILGAADRLQVCPDLDALCREAVETARTRLGLERCSVFLLRDGKMVGTYGTDMQGRTTSEHDVVLPINVESWLAHHAQACGEGARWKVLTQEERVSWDGETRVVVGKGWTVSTLIWPESAAQPLGVMYNDSAITRGPVDPMKQEAVAVFCAALGGIIERKRAEQERARLTLAIEQAAETIFITDADGAIQYLNPAFEAITGYTRDEALGCNPRILRSGEQSEAFYADLWGTLTGGDTWTGRLVNRTKDGALYTAEAVISPVRDADGRTINYVAVEHDITRELQQEEQLRQTQRMEAVGRLAGGVAHDFNNLLMGIMNYVELCRDELGPGHPVRGWLDEVTSDAQRSAAIVRQLLGFARKQVIAPHELDLNTTIAGMIGMLRRLVRESIRFSWVPSRIPCTVRMDTGQIDQLLANLVVNAQDAIEGTGTITIETTRVTIDDDASAQDTEAEPGEYVMLAVSDDGSGMDAATVPHIFEPFFTTKPLGEGTGLGLATVYGIAKQNGGFVRAYSEPGQGATFKVFLPRVQGDAFVQVEAAPKTQVAGGDEVILLVEDERSIRVTLKLSLEALGYTVLTADSPVKALCLLESWDGGLDLLITDVVLPEMTGPELAEQLTAESPELVCLYISGYAPQAVVDHGLLDEGAPFLQKPVALGVLAGKVRELLNGRPR